MTKISKRALSGIKAKGMILHAQVFDPELKEVIGLQGEDLKNFLHNPTRPYNVRSIFDARSCYFEKEACKVIECVNEIFGYESEKKNRKITIGTKGTFTRKVDPSELAQGYVTMVHAKEEGINNLPCYYSSRLDLVPDNILTILYPHIQVTFKSSLPFSCYTFFMDCLTTRWVVKTYLNTFLESTNFYNTYEDAVMAIFLSERHKSTRA